MDCASQLSDNVAKNVQADHRVGDGLRDRAIIPSKNYIDAAISKATVVLAVPDSLKSTAMDDLLGYMLDQFAGNPSSYEVSRVTTERARYPVSIEENVIPVMIIAELMSAQHLLLDVAKCSNWIPFVKRYGGAIMAA